MIRSTDECEISRSCHSATLSNAACTFAFTTRASPDTFSEPTGLRLCGMLDDPFCPAANNSSTSNTSVRWR